MNDEKTDYTEIPKQCTRYILGYTIFIGLYVLVQKVLPADFWVSFNNNNVPAHIQSQMAQASSSGTWEWIPLVIENLLPIVISLRICYLLTKQLKSDLAKDIQSESIAPTLMVAQGTYFTFLGVCYILFTYDPVNGKVAELLSGLKLAFVTSVIGLLSSINARAIIHTNRRNIARSNARYDLKQIDERDIYAKLQDLDNKMAQMQSQMGWLPEIDTQLEQIKNNNEQVLELRKISSYLSHISDTLEMQKNSVLVIKGLAYTIRDNQVESNEYLSNLEVNIKNSLGRSNDMMRANLDNLYQEMQANMANLSESVLGNVRECFGEIRNTTEETSKILAEIRDTTKSISISSETIDGHFINMKENAAQTDSEFQSIKEYLGGTMNSAKDYAEATTKAMDAAADAISKVSTINTNFAENAFNISSAVNSINSSTISISDVLNKVQNTSDSVASSVERISQTVGEYSSLNSQLVNTLKDTDLITSVEKVAEMEAKLSSNIQGQVEVVESIADSLHSLQIQLDEFKKLDDIMSAAFNSSNAVVLSIRQGAEAVSKEFSNLSDALAKESISQLNSYTTGVAEEMKKAQERYTENNRRAQEPFIEAVAKTLSTLDEKIERNSRYVLTTVEALNNKINEMDTRFARSVDNLNNTIKMDVDKKNEGLIDKVTNMLRGGKN